MVNLKSCGRKTSVLLLTLQRALTALIAAPEAQARPAGESGDLSGGPSRAASWVCVVGDQVSPGSLALAVYSIWGFSRVKHLFLSECAKSPGQVPWSGKAGMGGLGAHGTASLRVHEMEFSL